MCSPINSILLSLFFSGAALAGDFQVLCSDRHAIEAIYYEQRIGTNGSFAEAMPPETLQALVQLDLREEAALRTVYGIEITPAMLDTEVQRIETTTRAPETLAKIKAALGNNPARFARSFARPIIVERELKRNFEFDDSLHLGKRTEAEEARERLLSGTSLEGLEEITWQLGPRPETDTEAAPATSTLPVQANGKSNSYTVEATVQRAQVLGAAAREEGEEHLFYFEELHPELQKVLTVQLQDSGDLSAVIEGPGGFVVYQLKEKTTETLVVASLSIPKLDYTRWLAELKL